jgi:ABC-2 type transport system ATP-binding protein
LFALDKHHKEHKVSQVNMSDIVVRQLTKYYGELLAVDSISFDVNKGEVFGFLGPNGAGKTSTIRMLVGLSKPSNGTAVVAGHSITDDITEVKRHVGLVPEVSNLYDELSVWDNLLFMAQLYSVPKHKRAERIEDVLKSFDLTSRKTSRFGKLSKGLKRRVVIAASLIHEPDVLFLDEPTVGLDVVSAHTLRGYVERLGKNNTTVFLTTHYIEEADNLCDRIAILVSGKLVAVDTPAKIKNRVRVQPVIRAELSHMPDKPLRDKLSSLGQLEYEGRVIRLAVDDVSEALSAFMNITSNAGVSVRMLETGRPTLEDAFVELTGVLPDIIRAEKGGFAR